MEETSIHNFLPRQTPRAVCNQTTESDMNQGWSVFRSLQYAERQLLPGPHVATSGSIYEESSNQKCGNNLSPTAGEATPPEDSTLLLLR